MFIDSMPISYHALSGTYESTELSFRARGESALGNHTFVHVLTHTPQNGKGET